MVLSDKDILDRCNQYSNRPMINPFVNGQVREEDGQKVISYGLSSYGYDARLDRVFFKPTAALVPDGLIDVKRMDNPEFMMRFEGDDVVIPPNSYVIGQTLEEFIIPRDIIVICIGKSTYTRVGLLMDVATLEPEWKGHVTMTICNSAPLPAKVYAKEGICQFLFLKAASICQTSYADKKGKYQDQNQITFPKV